MKYIDSENLIAEIERFRATEYDSNTLGDNVANSALDYVLEEIIPSLQQEQPDNEDIDKVAQELYEHLYELKRRNNVPTNLYDKQEIIALWKAGIEYAYNHPKQEKRVDLEKAALHVYESWMGGTTDDVRRDIVELGKVLNARKEE